MWDPAQYLRFDAERSRPFFDLVHRVRTQHPAIVADLGCGPGNLTAALARRWPDAQVCGIDSDPRMIEAARQLLRASDAPSGLSFASGDLRDWRPERPADVIVSNAVLQWVPGHEQLLSQWAATLPPGGCLAVQIPGNFDQPSHVIARDLAASSRWRPLLTGVELNRQAADPAGYLDLLGRAGCDVDAWETTYLHVLPGPDPIVEWYKGSGLRPILSVLNAEQSGAFLAEYGARAREAYPPAPYGTILPFRRVFVVAQRR